MRKKKPPQDTPPRQPSAPTLKQVHRSGEILIPGGVGSLISFAQPKPKPRSVSHTQTEEEMLSRLQRPGIISYDDMITLKVLQDRYQKSKGELNKFAKLIIDEIEKGTPVEKGARKIIITGVYTHREEDAE